MTDSLNYDVQIPSSVPAGKDVMCVIPPAYPLLSLAIPVSAPDELKI
jgi:hypothetical protein